MKASNLDALLRMAPAYALGALDGGDLVRFEAALPEVPELQEEVTRYRETLGMLGVAQPPVSPPPELKARLMERVRSAELAAHPLTGMDFDALDWTAVDRGSGVQVHILRHDRETEALTLFLRGDPGATYPDHRHPGGESFFVLQGRFRDHRAEYATGDFHSFPPGSEHRDLRITGKHPCILLIVTGPGGITPLEDGASG